jgi:hypothetical protein
MGSSLWTFLMRDRKSGSLDADWLQIICRAGVVVLLVDFWFDGGLFKLATAFTGDSNEQLNWRRPLWEEFYPRIRHESSPEDAAKVVLKHLHERVTITTVPNPPHDVSAIWLKQTTDEAGFEIIYVAALRSVGVPARLDSNRHAEFWDGNKWLSNRQPSV